MEDDEKNPNTMYLVPDILEEIFLRLPFKPLLRFKIVSKEWKSIIESRRLRERRMEVPKKKRTILAVKDRTKPSFQGDKEEMEMVYMNCDDAATRPLLTCDGLLCIPVPGWVNVLNPSTRQVLSFPSGPDPGTNLECPAIFADRWWQHFPGCWEMGFGMDKVSGSYKVVRMFFNGDPRCEILDVNIGEWRKLSPPSYNMYSRRKSVCVNGSIYWLEYNEYEGLLALDLHTEEFRHVQRPPIGTMADQVVNLEGRLAIARPFIRPSFWRLEIRILDAEEKTWTLTYSIDLVSIRNPREWKVWFRPLVFSEKGNLYIHDSENRLFKYDPETDVLTCLSSDICVLCPYVENLVSLAPPSSVSVMKTCKYQSGFHSLDHVPLISKIFGQIKPQIPKILLTTSLVSLVMSRSFIILSRSRRC